MAKRKNNKVDSAAKKVEAFELAQSGIPSPPNGIRLHDDETPYWVAIVGAKRPDAWTESDLVDAANLAKNEARGAKLMERLRKEPLTKGGNINPVYQHLDKEVDRLSRLILATKRHLQIHPLATHGPSKEQSNRNKKAKDIKQVFAEMPDSLIAGVVQ